MEVASAFCSGSPTAFVVPKQRENKLLPIESSQVTRSVCEFLLLHRVHSMSSMLLVGLVGMPKEQVF